MSNTVESFSALLRRALGDRLDAGAASFAEMFDPDGVMEFPFAYAGLPTRIEGREALTAHLAMLSTLISFDRMAIHRTELEGRKSSESSSRAPSRREAVVLPQHRAAHAPSVRRRPGRP